MKGFKSVEPLNFHLENAELLVREGELSPIQTVLDRQRDALSHTDQPVMYISLFSCSQLLTCLGTDFRSL